MFEEIEDILTLPDIQYLLGIGKNTALKLIHSGLESSGASVRQI